MAIYIKDVPDFYDEVKSIAAGFGLTVSEAILVLAVEDQARRKRDELNVVADSE